MSSIAGYHGPRTRSAMAPTQSPAHSEKVGRIPALDFTKGTLVLFMVLYHWINYFVGPKWAYYRYLRFLTPSFIFITGFMISNVYLSRFDAADPRLLKRLLNRGMKLIAIFVFLNVARDCMLSVLSTDNMLSTMVDPHVLFAIFITGDFTGKVIAFYILVPIAYLLIVSGLLIVPLRLYRYTFHVACLVLLVVIAVLSMYRRQSQIIEIVSIGVLGTLAGFLPIGMIKKAARHPCLLAFVYLLYMTAIAIWNVPYPLEVIGTCLSVTIIYLAGFISWKPLRIRKEVMLLGKYSLFGYISQIVILQILHATFLRTNLNSGWLVISFVAAFALSVIAVELIDYARVRVASLDGLYRTVFN